MFKKPKPAEKPKPGFKVDVSLGSFSTSPPSFGEGCFKKLCNKVELFCEAGDEALPDKLHLEELRAVLQASHSSPFSKAAERGYRIFGVGFDDDDVPQPCFIPGNKDMRERWRRFISTAENGSTFDVVAEETHIRSQDTPPGQAMGLSSISGADQGAAQFTVSIRADILQQTAARLVRTAFEEGDGEGEGGAGSKKRAKKSSRDVFGTMVDAAERITIEGKSVVGLGYFRNTRPSSSSSSSSRSLSAGTVEWVALSSKDDFDKMVKADDFAEKVGGDVMDYVRAKCNLCSGGDSKPRIGKYHFHNVACNMNSLSSSGRLGAVRQHVERHGEEERSKEARAATYQKERTKSASNFLAGAAALVKLTREKHAKELSSRPPLVAPGGSADVALAMAPARTPYCKVIMRRSVSHSPQKLLVTTDMLLTANLDSGGWRSPSLVDIEASRAVEDAIRSLDTPKPTVALMPTAMYERLESLFGFLDDEERFEKGYLTVAKGALGTVVNLAVADLVFCVAVKNGMFALIIMVPPKNDNGGLVFVVDSASNVDSSMLGRGFSQIMRRFLEEHHGEVRAEAIEVVPNVQCPQDASSASGPAVAVLAHIAVLNFAELSTAAGLQGVFNSDAFDGPAKYLAQRLNFNNWIDDQVALHDEASISPRAGGGGGATVAAALFA
jgi:hypothetical protein